MWRPLPTVARMARQDCSSGGLNRQRTGLPGLPGRRFREARASLRQNSRVSDTILITGANRGIGLGLAAAYAGDGWQVIASCRRPDKAEALKTLAARSAGRVRLEYLDVAYPASIDDLASRLAGQSLDLLINNAGAIGPRDPQGSQLHRQRFGSLDYEAWLEVLRVNALGPMKMAEAFLPHLETGRQKKIATLSSSIGTISEARAPAYLYATSKTALNKALTLLADELKPRGISVGIYCPGHVKTELGGEGASVEVADSVAGLRSLIASLDLQSSGCFRRYDGAAVAW